jgi:hypothetical protein
MKKYSNYSNNKDVSRIAWSDLVPKKDNISSENERLSENIMVSQKGKFDDSNNLINSLQSEILSLKKKLSLITDKDKEIFKLKFDIKQLRDINSKYLNSENENSMIQNDKSKLLDENNNLKDQLIKLDNTNKILKNEIYTLKNLLPNNNDTNNTIKNSIDDYSINSTDQNVINDSINKIYNDKQDHIDNIDNLDNNTIKEDIDIDDIKLIDINYRKFKKILVHKYNNLNKITYILNELDINSDCKLEKNTIRKIINLINN